MRPFLIALGLIVGLLGPATAARATYVGNDVSWPQCPVGIGDGQGQPYPGGAPAFAIVGLTNGTAFHENPCLERQWSWATTHAEAVGVYTMATNPSPGQLAATQQVNGGPCRHLDMPCQRRTAGWNEGAFAAASLRRIGAHVPYVWIDVESRRRQPWSGNTRSNAQVVQGLAAGLAAAHLRYGFYSNAYFWRGIVGSLQTSAPEWYPAGSASASAGCDMHFAGGVTFFSQKTVGSHDFDYRCDAGAVIPTVFQVIRPRYSPSPLLWFLDTVLRPGGSGAAAAALQRRLHLPATGRYTGAAVAEIQHIQRVHGLRPTGVVARSTWKLLGA